MGIFQYLGLVQSKRKGGQGKGSVENNELSAATKADGKVPQIPVLAVIGSTGVGKSSLCNTLAGKDHDDEGFPVGHGAAACTNDTTDKAVYFRGKETRPVILIDTPGLNHEEVGADNYNLVQEVECLKRVGRVNTFLLVINGSNPRFDKSLINTLENYRRQFGEKFLETNGVLAVTNWSLSEGLKGRRGKRNRNEILKTDELNKSLKDHGFIGGNAVVPVVFIDALYDHWSVKQRHKLKNEMNELWGNLRKYPALSCNDINAVTVEDDLVAEADNWAIWRLTEERKKQMGLNQGQT